MEGLVIHRNVCNPWQMDSEKNVSEEKVRVGAEDLCYLLSKGHIGHEEKVIDTIFQVTALLILRARPT